MRVFYSLFFVFCFWVQGLPAVASMTPSIQLTQEERTWLLEHPTIVLASNNSLSMAFADEEKKTLRGFDVELIEQINQNLNINLTLKMFDGWESAYKAATSKKVDGILSITPTKARESLFDFSPIYHQDPTYIITQKDEDALHTLEDLNGQTIATENMSIINDVLRESVPTINLVHAPTINDILELVSQKKARGALLEGINREYLDSLGFKVSGVMFLKSGEYTIGTDKNKPMLGKIITKGIRSITKEQKQRLKDTWLNKQYNTFSFTSDELTYINSSRVLKIGIEEWPPMISTKDGKKIEGIVGELLTRVIEITGLKVQLIKGKWKDLLQEFKEGKIDILPATYYTKERATYGLFSDSYTSIANVLYVTNDNNTIKSFADLKHKRLAIQKGFGTIDAIVQKFPDITIVETATLEEAILKVSNKEADAFFEAQIVAQEILKKLLINNIKPVFQNDIEAGTLHIFSKKQDTVLLSIINKALKSIPSQEKNEIIDKWLHQEVRKSVNVALPKGKEPYAMDSPLLKGIAYDLMARVLDKSKISINYEKFVVPEKIETVVKEDTKVDLAVGVVREEEGLFYSNTLVNFENVVVTRKDSHFIIEHVLDLKHKKILAFKGASHALGGAFEALFDSSKMAKTYYETAREDEQVFALVNKKVDVIILDKNVFHWYLRKNHPDQLSQYTIHPIFPEKNSYKVAFKEKNIRDIFNENLDKMKRSGEYTDIFYEYLQTDIKAKATIGRLVGSLVGKSIFTNDIKTISEICTVFGLLPYMQKIEVFTKEDELLYTYTNQKANRFIQYDSVHNISYISHKVGYVKLYIDDVKLVHYLQNNTVIPPVTSFEHLASYQEIEAIYKKLDFLDRPTFSKKEEAFIKRYPIIDFMGFLLKPLYLVDTQGALDGVYVDFLKAIEHQSGLKFTMESVETKEEMYTQFKSKDVALMVDAENFVSTKPTNLLSDSFLNVRLAIIMPEKGTFTDGLGSLRGRVALSSNTNAYYLVKTFYPQITIVEAQTPKEALAMVAKGKVDAYVCNEAIAPYLLADYPNLKVVGISEETIDYSFVSSAAYPELISIINKSLATLSYEKKEAILEKWIKIKINTAVDYSMIYKVVAIFLIILFVAVLSNRRLKYLVHKKTLELENLLVSFDNNVIAAKLSSEGKIIYASRALCAILEYTQEELLGNKIESLIPKTNKRTLKGIKKALLGQKKWAGKIISLSKTGKTYWMKTTLFPEYDENELFLNYTIISQDITAQREIENLNKEIEETQREIIFKMGAIGEARSQETGVHVKRVAEYSRLFAHYCGLSSEEARIIKLASPMHDIGKVAIADSILNKPGRLSDEEFEIIKTHARLGYEMLCNSKRTIIKTAAIIAHEHHEKWDGTGYPRGLKGEEIHLYGRITAIADVFDALGHKRVYKEAWEDEQIFAFFKEERGKHFDPRLVDIFFEHIDKFLAIKNSFKDEA